jgi:hypothetical protein
MNDQLFTIGPFVLVAFVAMLGVATYLIVKYAKKRK